MAARLFASPVRDKRKRMAKLTPLLPRERWNGRIEDHIVGINPKKYQRVCQYCAYLKALSKRNGDTESHNPRRVTRICLACNVHICHAHFDVYHSRNTIEV